MSRGPRGRDKHGGVLGVPGSVLVSVSVDESRRPFSYPLSLVNFRCKVSPGGKRKVSRKGMRRSINWSSNYSWITVVVVIRRTQEDGGPRKNEEVSR